MFNEKKVVGFTNDNREEENDLLFDVIFDDEIEADDSKNIVTADIKEEVPDVELKDEEVSVDEDISSIPVMKMK